MSLVITSITINTQQLQPMLAFYQIIGFAFNAVKVDKGSEVYKAIWDGLEFSIYSIPNVQKKAAIPNLQLGFTVTNLKEIVDELLEVAGVMCIIHPSEVPGGDRAVVLDPDGHSIQFFEGETVQVS